MSTPEPTTPEIENAKKVLEEYGFIVNKIWSIADMAKVYPIICSGCIKDIMEKAIASEEVEKAVYDKISEILVSALEGKDTIECKEEGEE